MLLIICGALRFRVACQRADDQNYNNLHHTDSTMFMFL